MNQIARPVVQIKRGRTRWRRIGSIGSQVQGAAQKRAKAILLMGAYLAALYIAYSEVISPMWGYYGLPFRAIPFSVVAGNVILVLIPALLLPMRIARPSDITAWTLYLFVIAPSSFIPYMLVGDEARLDLHVLLTLLLGFFVFEFVRRGRPLPLPVLRSHPRFFSVALPWLAVGGSIVVWWFMKGGTTIAFNLASSERRLAAREVISPSSAMGYVQAVAVSVGPPLLVALAVGLRKWRYFLLALLIGFLTNATDGAKAPLFNPFFFAVVALFVMKPKHATIVPIVSFMAALVVAAVVEFRAVGTLYLCDLAVRRTLMVPSALSTRYIEFFSQNPPMGFADTILGKFGFLQNQYGQTVPRLIGHTYFGNWNTNANTGIWASGFAELGYIGTMLVSAAAGLLMKILDSLAPSRLPLRYLAGCTAAAAIGLDWVDGALHTSLITNGVILLLLLVSIFPIARAQSSPGMARVLRVRTGPAPLKDAGQFDVQPAGAQ